MWLLFIASKRQDPIIQWRGVTFQKNTILQRKRSSVNVQGPVMAKVKSKWQLQSEVRTHLTNAHGTQIVTVTRNCVTTAAGNFGDISLPRAANYVLHSEHSTDISNVPSQQQIGLSWFYTGTPNAKTTLHVAVETAVPASCHTCHNNGVISRKYFRNHKHQQLPVGLVKQQYYDIL